MTPDRRSRLTVRPNGALWDEQTFRAFLGVWDRRAKRPTVARLSVNDPLIREFEATARGIRAERAA